MKGKAWKGFLGLCDFDVFLWEFPDYEVEKLSDEEAAHALGKLQRAVDAQTIVNEMYLDIEVKACMEKFFAPESAVRHFEDATRSKVDSIFDASLNPFKDCLLVCRTCVVLLVA